MKPPVVLLLFSMVASAQSQPAPCGSSAEIAAKPVPSGKASPAAAKPDAGPPSEAPPPQVRRPPAQPPLACRCGTVSASSLTAQANVQEVPILTGLAGSFRFDHVLVQETTRFSSDSVGSLLVGVGRANLGPDVVSPFSLMSSSAPFSFWYERPAPPQLGGAYNLVLNFQAPAPLGDGTVSNFSSGTVAWEVCGYNRPAFVR